MYMDQWIEVFKGIIPKEKYQVSLKNGEESGLIIELKSKKRLVNITFGAVSAIRILEEGIILNGLFDEIQIHKFKKDGFTNVIYRVEKGEFGKFIENIAGELYEYLELKQFLVITTNYVIEVITEWNPQIHVYQ